MSRSQKLTALAMTVLTGIALYLFFAVKYRYHLHFQEQYQLFEWTGKYFARVVALPGGLADWAGRCITQFFYYAPLGAVLMALLLCAVQGLSLAVCRHKTLLFHALALIPVFLLTAFFCDENALVGAAVALCLSLGVAALCLKIGKDRLRHWIEVLLVPVMYMACGPLAAVYVLIVAIREAATCGAKALPVIAAFLVLAVLCPLIASRIFPYLPGRFLQGIHYYRYHNILPGLLWGAALSSVLLVLVSCFKARQTDAGWLPGTAAFVVIAALGAFLVLRAADASKEEWMRYDFMVRMQMWNRIMMTADAKNPDNPKTVSCLNLALAKTGRMANHQFDYFQNGPEGLFPSFVRDFTNPVSTGEVFWHLGMINTAQRYAFEAQEAIPDFQKSARFYQRLVETSIVNGDLAVARKYLKPLQHTLFYRGWANETLSLLDEGDIFAQRPELARARDLRLKEHDFLFSDTEMDSMLGLLKVENPSNSLALDYLMAWCLLRKDLDRFVECISMVDAPTMPKVYQEALLLRWVLTHNDFNGLPPYIAPAYAERISRFIADSQAGKSPEQIQRTYGDTYWFYYYYRYRSRQE